MRTKELLIDYPSDRQAVKRVHDSRVHRFTVLVATLQFEGEMAGQVSALMITTEKTDLVGETDFEGQEIEEAFKGKVAAIHVVAQEDETIGGWFPTGHLKYL